MSRRTDQLSLTPLTLGAAALGQVYGIANPKETMSCQAALSLLDRCWEAGIRSIDTAVAYGEAEERIGKWAADRAIAPVIMSKAPPLDDVPDDRIAEALGRSIDRSRSRLQVSTVDGYLLHNAADWRRPAVRAALRAAKEMGHIRACGVSAYDADDVLELLAIDRFDILQIPFSIFDRRAERSGLLARANELGIVVLARSVFLQGLLFLDPTRLAPQFQASAPHLTRRRELAADAGCDLSAVAIQAALNAGGISSVIVGLYTAEQVAQAAAAIAAPVEDELIREAIEIAEANPGDLRNPRLWRPT